MQSCKIRRWLYARTPTQVAACPSVLWISLPLMYRIVEARRQRLCTVEIFLFDNYRVSHIACMEQRFAMRGDIGDTELLIAKVVSGFLVVGTDHSIEWFVKGLGKRFVLGHVKCGSELKFLGCHIQQTDNDSIKLPAAHYFDRIMPLYFCPGGLREREQKAEVSETHIYQSLAGMLLYIRQAVLSQACLVAPRCNKSRALYISLN